MKTVNALYGIEKLRNLEQKEWETMHRILIIEDDFSLNNTLAYNLRTAGYTVDSAYNAKEAFKYLKQYHYILLILDINLPDGNGFELYSELKEKSNASIIFLTANDLENDIVKGFDLGADDYITKPFSPVVLQKKIAVLTKYITEKQKETGQSSPGIIPFGVPYSAIFYCE